ncbi:hypothetical protein U1Q18_015525 [Sarracenia purpurea var. burkii]
MESPCSSRESVEICSSSVSEPSSSSSEVPSSLSTASPDTTDPKPSAFRFSKTTLAFPSSISPKDCELTPSPSRVLVVEDGRKAFGTLSQLLPLNRKQPEVYCFRSHCFSLHRRQVGLEIPSPPEPFQPQLLEVRPPETSPETPSGVELFLSPRSEETSARPPFPSHSVPFVEQPRGSSASG